MTEKYKICTCERCQKAFSSDKEIRRKAEKLICSCKKGNTFPEFPGSWYHEDGLTLCLESYLPRMYRVQLK